jgi:hypothetical protein
VIELRLVVLVPHTGDEGMVALFFRPIDGFLLGLEGLENVVLVILDHVILNRRSLVAPLRARLDIDVTDAAPSPAYSQATFRIAQSHALRQTIAGGLVHTYLIVVNMPASR